MTKEEKHCLNCGCSDAEKPLVMLSFGGQPLSICPQCLPVLIHHPERLGEKLGTLS